MSGFRHVVLARFAKDASQADREAVMDALRAMPSQVPEIRGLRFGVNVGTSPNAYDLAVVIDFDDVAAFRRYLTSEAHRTYVAGPGRSIAELAVVQHE